MNSSGVKVILVFIALALNINAQNKDMFIGVNLGVNHSWFIYPKEYPLESDFNPSLSFGADFNKVIFSNTVLSAGLRIADIGRYSKTKYNDINETAKIYMIYINLPVKIEYNIIENFYGVVNFEPAFLLFSRYKVESSSQQKKEKTFTNEMNRFNIFAGVGVKYIFNIYDKDIGVSGMINFGLLNVPKSDTFYNEESDKYTWIEWKTREILLSFEYYFSI